jgi:hypothetical protein
MLATAKRHSESTMASTAGSQHCVFLFEGIFTTHTCQKKSNNVQHLSIISIHDKKFILEVQS